MHRDCDVRQNAPDRRIRTASASRVKPNVSVVVVILSGRTDRRLHGLIFRAKGKKRLGNFAVCLHQQQRHLLYSKKGLSLLHRKWTSRSQNGELQEGVGGDEKKLQGKNRLPRAAGESLITWPQFNQSRQQLFYLIAYGIVFVMSSLTESLRFY